MPRNAVITRRNEISPHRMVLFRAQTIPEKRNESGSNALKRANSPSVKAVQYLG